MAAVKTNILKRWDTAPAGVRVCCIKFVQKVVQVQTPAVIDPRVRDMPLILPNSPFHDNDVNCSGLTKTRYRLLLFLETTLYFKQRDLSPSLRDC